LGYRLHLVVDAKSELPVAIIVASTNENEKRHSLKLLDKASHRVKIRKLVGDPQYSSQNFYLFNFSG
jgi:hypothetical protein